MNEYRQWDRRSRLDGDVHYVYITHVSIVTFSMTRRCI